MAEAALAPCTVPATQTDDELLAEDLGRFASDPLGYVMYAFPWDTDPSIQLVPLQEPWKSKYGCEWGPDKWACEYLDALGEEIKKRGFSVETMQAVEPIRTAIASGHGIGKSALVGMLTCFLLDTRPNSKGIVTANTGEQLRTKTFAQMSKWRKLSITAHWWDILEGDMVIRHKMHRTEWRVGCVTWKKERSEAFAGLHEATSSPWYIMDESSAVDDVIGEVAQGGLTDGEPFFLIFGNPTRKEGFFYEAFHKMRHRFHITMQIDSRDCHITNKALFQEWIDDFGVDSDFVRIRVRGIFPRASQEQLISHEIVALATHRSPEVARTDPLVIGVDVGRGTNESVICFRRGSDAVTVPWIKLRLDDTMKLVGHITKAIDDRTAEGFPPAAVFIDEGGLGGPVIDRVRQLGYAGIIGVNNGIPSDEDARYYNRAGQNWCRMRDWLKDRGCVDPDDLVLQDQLTGRHCDFDKHNRIAVEKKEDMQERGLESPDRADALANTFDQPVAPREPDSAGRRRKAKTEYDPYADEKAA
jgi:hypothetical protein